MCRALMKTAFALSFLFAVGLLRANEPADSAPAARGNVPAWEVPATAFKMGLVSTAILSFAEPEVALAHASILTPRLHGNVGEAFVNSRLHATGGWKPISPRNGPQGIDHVWMKFDRVGRPVGLIVGETKFGTSRLGTTKSGRQMSASWISKRLAKLAGDWDEMAKDVAARLGDAKAAPFRWRADYLRAAAEGRIAYRSELYRVKVKGDMAKISVQRLGADGFATGAERALSPIKIEGQSAKIVKAQLMGEIRRIYPALDDDPAGRAEIRRLANRMYAEAKTAQGALSPKSAKLRLAGTTGAVLAAGGLVAGGFDAVAQLWTGGEFDWNRTGTMAGIGTVSAGSAEGVQLAMSSLLKNSAFRPRSLALGRSMGLSSLRTTAFLPKAAGGIVGALMFSYGGRVLGLYDIREANRTAIAGTAGAAAGGLVSYGMMAVASTWGAASTGTPIATLYGAAATKASLAWLGGGAVSAGGGGMAWGAAVVGGVATVAIVGVTAAVLYGFHCYDEAEDWERVGNTIEVLRTHNKDFPGNPWAVRPVAEF